MTDFESDLDWLLEAQVRGEVAAWRLDDVAEYDSMRELGNELIATLCARALVDVASPANLDEVAQVREALLAVDGFDRAKVRHLSAALSRRLWELQQ